MLHRFGHGLLVILVACLCLLPARAEAATIDLGTFSTGSFDITGTFDADNDIALIFLELLGTAVVSVEMTSQLDTPAGFDQILTLFGPGSDFLGAFDFLGDNAFGFLEPVTLSAGNYVLAVSHDLNYYFPGSGFDYALAPSGALTADIAGFFDGTTCPDFLSLSGDCRSREFAGTLSIQPENVQPVPEPGSLVLLMAGGAALLARRRHWKRSGSSAVTEN
jgi:hypothetical protein